MNARLTLAGSAALLALAAAGGAVWWQHSRSPAPPPEAYAIPDDAADTLPLPPVPPRVADSPEYEHCLSLLDNDPADAAAYADTWQGGIAARHCRALADVALGQAAAGAALLDQIGADAATPDAARPVMLQQAVQAWMLAGKPDLAVASGDRALALAPDDADLLIGRANAETALGRYEAAATDLTAALASDPQRTDALVARGTARRHLGQVAGARADLEQALAIDPDLPEALLERGILLQRAGDRAGAQRDWSRAAELAPDSQTGDLAAQNLELLAVGPSR